MYTTNSPLSIDYNNLANHKLVTKCIEVKGLGSSVCTTQTGETLELGRVGRFNM